MKKILLQTENIIIFYSGHKPKAICTKIDLSLAYLSSNVSIQT